MTRYKDGAVAVVETDGPALANVLAQSRENPSVRLWAWVWRLHARPRVC